MKKSATSDLESSLKVFISWYLTQSSSNNQDNADIQLLDCAWEAQKLLWKLRYSSTR
jgi:hypothetical protein